MQVVLGIDIGGTSIKAGVFSLEGSLLASASAPTGAVADEAAYARVVRFLRGALHEAGAAPADVVGVGVDVPGPVDHDGAVGMLANIELDPDGLRRAFLAAFSPAAVVFANDANAAALGEYWQGAARGVDDFVLIAIGTGVGGGVVCGGQLVAGAFGAGGEIGHLTVNPAEQDACGCGRRGCLEQYASATGVVQAYLHACAKRGVTPAALDGPTDTLSVFRACECGDDAAREAIRAMADCLGFALAQVSALLDPPLYLVGGGVSAGWRLFADDLRAAYRRNCLGVSREARIAPAALGNDAALYGSAFLAMGQQLQ